MAASNHREPRARPAPGPEVAFEELYTALEEKARRLEQGNLPLEESLKLYEEGAALVHRLREILDSAELRLNGRRLGRRAWAPWRWALPGVREGENSFELLVYGNGGNQRKLVWPNQPQGWIGRAWLRLIRCELG